MAFCYSRKVWNNCWIYTHHFLKYKTAYCAVKPCQLINNFCGGHAKQCTFVTCSKYVYPSKERHSSGELTNCSFRPFDGSLLRKTLSSCSALLQNKVAGSDISTVLDDINFEEIKEQVLKERKETKNPDIHFITRIKEVVGRKCDEVLANLSPEDEKKLKVIKLEHNFLFCEGYRIPSAEQLTSENWLQALKLTSKSQRLKYYIHINRCISLKELKKKKQAAPKEEKPQVERPEVYEHGRIFMRIYESTMKRAMDYRLVTSMQFGIPLVLDMDYSAYMRQQERSNTAEQIQDLYSINKADEAIPFHLHFTSCPENNPVFRLFQIYMNEAMDVLATVSEKSYLELFDRDSLVYLSPESREVMKQFDPTAVYIIGAYNDKATQKPISYARAKEQKIKSQRLPLDHYLDWNLGSKSLTLDQMMKIMVSLKNGKPWLEALKAVPQRKLKNLNNSDN